MSEGHLEGDNENQVARQAGKLWDKYQQLSDRWDKEDSRFQINNRTTALEQVLSPEFISSEKIGYGAIGPFITRVLEEQLAVSGDSTWIVKNWLEQKMFFGRGSLLPEEKGILKEVLKALNRFKRRKSE